MCFFFNLLQADEKSRRSLTGVDFEEVRRAQKSEKPGAQQVMKFAIFKRNLGHLIRHHFVVEKVVLYSFKVVT